MVEKLGQFKIQQMSFMLMAVVLLFALVAMFYITIQYRNLHSLASNLEENKAILMANYISGATEFSCAGEQYCIDSDKLIVLENNSMYKDFWPVAYIKIRKIYPSGEDVICNKANYPECNLYNVYSNNKIKSQNSIGTFVALCRYEKLGKYPNRICEFGKMIIGYEVK